MSSNKKIIDLADAEFLKRYRSYRGLTQEQLADTLKISVDTVRRIEQGLECISAFVWERLTRFFDDDELISYILDGTTSARLNQLARRAMEHMRNSEYLDVRKSYDDYCFFLPNNLTVVCENRYGKKKMYRDEVVRQMIGLTMEMEQGTVKNDYIAKCNNAIKLVGIEDAERIGYVLQELDFTTKQLMNLKGLGYMRLGDSKMLNAADVFKALFLCLEYEAMRIGSTETLNSQMSAVLCNWACCEYFMGNTKGAWQKMSEALERALNGAPFKRCRFILECRHELEAEGDSFARGGRIVDEMEDIYARITLKDIDKISGCKRGLRTGILML